MASNHPHQPRNIDELLHRATLPLRDHDPQQAERIAHEVIRSSPHDVRAVRILAYALFAQGRAQDVIAALERVSHGLGDSEIDTQLALALRQVGRNEDAISELRCAINRRSPFPPAFYELSTLLCLANRYDEAIDVLDSGVQFAPVMPELSIQLGFVLLDVKNYDRAKIAFVRALELSGKSAHALSGMGKALQGIGEHRTAIEYFRRCLTHAPNDTGVLLDLAFSLLEVGDPDAAYDCLRNVASRDQKRYFLALSTLLRSRKGRFWLRPSDADTFLRKEIP